MVTRKWVCSVKCWCSLWHKYQSGPNWIILLWLRCSGLVSLSLGGCFQPYICGCSDFNSTGGELNTITKQPNRFFCLENLQTKSVYSSLFITSGVQSLPVDNATKKVAPHTPSQGRHSMLQENVLIRVKYC